MELPEIVPPRQRPISPAFYNPQNTPDHNGQYIMFQSNRNPTPHISNEVEDPESEETLLLRNEGNQDTNGYIVINRNESENDTKEITSVQIPQQHRTRTITTGNFEDLYKGATEK